MSNTILCLNQDCLTNNSISNKFCEKCGEKILLRERYQAVKLIGQGGFGRTFLAKDLDKPSKPYCVIKQFFPSAQGTNNIEKASELFAQEAERLEQLGKHPQIPELFAYFVTDDGRQYLVQEYIAGENLQSELENHGVYQESEVKELLIEILNILKFVHENQVIHRDIKPDNIIRRNSDQKLVLVDFGAAKYITSQSALNVTGTVIGAAQYCSPEQARGKPIFASDLYSLGVTCIHLLTLVDPFQLFDISENDWAWRDYLVNNPVSEQFGQVLDQLIAMGLKKRFANVEEVLNFLYDKYLLPRDSSVQTKLSPIFSEKVSNISYKNKPKREVKYSKPNRKNAKKRTLGVSNEYPQNKKETIETITFDLANGINLEMVYIPGGIFDMGSNSYSESPIHKVNIKPFYLGKYPITQAQYEAIMKNNPSHFQGLSRPVEKVSWDMAQKFCHKLSEKVGHRFSLPSESQWEYACRAGIENQHSYQRNFHFASNNFKITYAVGIYPPNAFGLHDMYSNLCEWCEDSWHENYLGHPDDGSAWVVPDNDKKLLRGGPWANDPSFRMTFLFNDSSVFIDFNIGFRVCCEIL